MNSCLQSDRVLVFLTVCLFLPRVLKVFLGDRDALAPTSFDLCAGALTQHHLSGEASFGPFCTCLRLVQLVCSICLVPREHSVRRTCPEMLVPALHASVAPLSETILCKVPS